MPVPDKQEMRTGVPLGARQTVIGHFRQLLDMDVTVIGHLHIFSNIVKYIYNMYP